ncbi:MAG: CHRD domain-containing protein [Ignavibacteriales bacterium]
MNKIYNAFLLILLLCFVLLLPSANLYSESKEGKKLNKTMGLPNKAKMNINNISTWIYNNGDSDLDPSQQAGFTYPKGSGKTAIFESGFLWGAKVKGEIRVGGSAYRQGLQPGKIISPGTPEDPNLDKNRIYRVRPDYKTANLTTESREESMSEDEVRAQYDKDWNEWPAADGAPYEDVNANGTFDAGDIPGVPGASQTIWYVANDLNASLTTNMYGSQPMGIEMQATMWAYSQAGPLSNMFFRRYKIINKSTTDFTDMYVTMWSDPDVGNSTDDFAGCDTTLSLGFAYNASPTDATYKELAPPAVGFDFFQGPVVAGVATDSAITGGRVIKGKRNLPMTAFYYFARGDLTVVDPTQGSYEGTLQFYNFMQGRVGKTGELFKTPQGKTTTFALPGDPVTGTGWIDGQIIAPDDRRIGLASGPFTMAVGDTQEVVVAEIAAIGSDRLQSVKLLKSYDIKAQDAYNSFFKIPTGAAPPQVTATPLDRSVVLAWGDPTTSALTESYNTKGFKFQGYNVYQLPSPSATFENAKLIATYDIKDTVGTIYGYVFDPRTGKPELAPIQFGTNSGLQRSITINKDFLNGGIALNNGSRYYYAVTSYSFNPDPTEVPNVLENPLSIITVVPASLDPGYATGFNPGDTLRHSSIQHTGTGDATVEVKIIDPTKTTGQTYSIGFSTQPDKFAATYTPPDSALTKGAVEMTGDLLLNEAATQLKYNITITNFDSLTGPVTAAYFNNGATILKNITFTASQKGTSKLGTAIGTWTSTDAQQPLTPAILQALEAGKVSVTVVTAQNPTGEISADFSITSYPWYISRGDQRVLSDLHNYSMDEDYPIIDGIQIKVGNLTFLPPTAYLSAEQTVKANSQTRPIVFTGDATYFGGATGRSFELFPGATAGTEATNADLIQDLELRFTGVKASAAAEDTTIVSGGQLAIAFSSNQQANAKIRIPFELWEVERNRQINVAFRSRNFDTKDPWGAGGAPTYMRIRGSRAYIVPVATPYSDTITAASVNPRSPKATWFLYFDADRNHWDTGDKFVIKFANNLIPGTDTYTFTAPAPVVYNADLAKQDVNRINVFPNPYYGVNPQEVNKYQRFVTFNHLPKDATIRIYNIAGTLVRTITRAGAASQFERWDLANESGLPVASGIYIAYIEMPGLGSKILKVAIIQEQQVLDRF